MSWTTYFTYAIIILAVYYIAMIFYDLKYQGKKRKNDEDDVFHFDDEEEIASEINIEDNNISRYSNIEDNIGEVDEELNEEDLIENIYNEKEDIASLTEEEINIVDTFGAIYNSNKIKPKELANMDPTLFDNILEDSQKAQRIAVAN